MSDIVERLRGPRTEQGGLWPHPNLHDEAADTIEALRAENARLIEAITELTEENRLVGLQMDRLADEIERLREALKPFADLYHPEDNIYLDMRLEAGFNPGIVVPMKDLRAARVAMGERDD